MFVKTFASICSPMWAMTNMFARQMYASQSYRFPVPVISIGNIVAGGVGKTELCISIASYLRNKGLRVCVAMRGYGSKWETQAAVAQDFLTAQSLEFPDEALVVLKKVPSVSVSIGRERKEVLLKNWETIQPDVILLDDGFQHFKIYRDLDILVHRFDLNWPILRDFPRTLNCAGLRVSFSDVPSSWSVQSNNKTWVEAQYELASCVNLQNVHVPFPKKALVFCGIGNPERFQKDLTSKGVEVQDLFILKDHVNYDQNLINKLKKWRQKNGAQLTVITTLKDFVKLVPFLENSDQDFSPLWVDISIKFKKNESIFWEEIEKALHAKK